MTGLIHLTPLGSALNYLYHSRVIDGFDTLDDLEKVAIHANPIAKMSPIHSVSQFLFQASTSCLLLLCHMFLPASVKDTSQINPITGHL